MYRISSYRHQGGKRINSKQKPLRTQW